MKRRCHVLQWDQESGKLHVLSAHEPPLNFRRRTFGPHFTPRVLSLSTEPYSRKNRDIATPEEVVATTGL